MASKQWAGGDFNDIVGAPTFASRDASQMDQGIGLENENQNNPSDSQF